MAALFEAEVARLYDLRGGNDIVLNGVSLAGFGESNAVEYEYPSQLMEDGVGADGFVHVSVLNDNRMYATFSFMETSKTHAYVYTLLQAQLTAIKLGQQIPRLTFYHYDKLNGDLVRTDQAIFLTRPQPSKAKTAGERQFKIILPYAGDPTKLQIGTRMLATT